MLKVVLKGLMAHKVRLALTTLAVVLGVSFVAGSFILTDSVDDAFSELFATTSEGTDLLIAPASEFTGDQMPSFVSQLEPLSASVLEEVRATDGVEGAVGWVEGVATIVDPEGEPVGGNGPPRLGFSWTGEDGPLSIKQGAAPDEPGEVAIDAVTAERTGYGIGDEVLIVTQAGPGTYEVVAIVGFGDEDNLLGATIASFSLDQARQLFDKAGVFDQIAVVAEDGQDVLSLRERLATSLGDEVSVQTAEQANEDQLGDIRSFLSIINGVLLGFAFVAMFVGAFIIANTFSIIVAQRTREFALLRAIGASAQQVKRAVRGEALVIGLVASVLGLLLGIGFAQGLKALLDSFGFGIPTGGVILAPRTIVWSFVVGVGVTLTATIIPARRASSVAPVEAMRGAATADDAPLRRRTTVGLGLLAFGVVLFGLGSLTTVGNGAVFIGVGAVVVLLGVATASPALASPIAAVVGELPARLGTAGRIARGNAARDRRRTAITASALMIGLAVVTFATVLAASVTGSIDRTLDEQFTADLLVSTGQPELEQLPPAAADRLEELDEIGAVTRIRFASASVGGASSSVAGVEARNVTSLVGLTETGGELDTLAGDEVFVLSQVAEDRGLGVGDTIEITFGRTGTQRFTVAGTFDDGDLVGAPYLLPLDTFAANVTGSFDATVFANAADGVSVPDAKAAAEEALSAIPTALVRDQAQLRAEAEDSVGQVLGLMMVMLSLAIVVALLGITNTLALAVFERTREIGLLRAVGMTRRQVKAMIRWEATIVSVFGAVLGVVVGTIFGWALVRSLADEGFTTLVIPAGQLIVYVVAAGFAGVVAAAFPARRAAKLDVLEAVTVE